MKNAAAFVPVLLRFAPASARQDAWGRLTVLTAGGAELSTGVRLTVGEGAFLDFEVDAEDFRGVRAIVAHAEDDADGRRLVELRFVDEVQRRRLAKVLAAVLARS